MLSSDEKRKKEKVIEIIRKNGDSMLEFMKGFLLDRDEDTFLFKKEEIMKSIKLI